jgi:nucleoside 2-deoxyribosyltransferase
MTNKGDRMIDNMYVYIAAPFFNEVLLRRLENVKLLLEKLNINYFSPKDASMFMPGITTPEEIFNVNVKALKQTNVLVCITDDKDTGTIFEAGYCSALSIPIIYLWTTAKSGQKFNIMLAASGSVCKTYAQLADALEDIQTTRDFNRKDWSEDETHYE